MSMYLRKSKVDKTPATSPGRPAVLRAEMERVISRVMTRRRCCVTVVEGMVFEDVKKEATGLDKGPGVGSRGHWEIVCLTD